MIQYRKILELHFSGTTQRTIEVLVGSSRHTIREIVQRANEKNLIELSDDMTDLWIEGYLFPEKSPKSKGYFEEDWEYVHKELGKKHMTLTLLHQEYSERAKDNQAIPYAYRTYCRFYQNYAHKYKVTMPLKRKPGEILEVDWAGSTLYLENESGGDPIPVYLFVATLPFSQYFYAEGFLDMKSENWLTAHIHTFEYFQGVPEVIVPDNLKTGITKADYAEPYLNAAYQNLANYYDATIVPSRIKKPKDKASVENHVGYASRQIIAALRNAQCFHLNELNDLIFKKVECLNQAPFQKKQGSRLSVFLEEESSYLKRLREPRFQISDWRVAKVQLNYHIQIERNYYSVPFEYVQCQVDIRLTKDLVEVYFKQSRIASHKRIYNKTNQYSTNMNHMPEHHREYLEHTPQSSRQWAKNIGPFTSELIEILLNQQVEKRALKIISGIRKLEKTYSPSLIETSSEILLAISQQPTLKTFKRVISKEAKQLKNSQQIQQQTQDNNYGFTRGAEYFGREKE